MNKESRLLHVFRVRVHMTGDPSVTFWRWVRENSRTDYEGTTTTTKVDDATHYDIEDVENIIKAYHKLAKRHGEVEFVTVHITQEVTPVDLASDEFMEERRRVALAKLTREDIAALGVEDMAVLSKLKFHNSPTREEY